MERQPDLAASTPAEATAAPQAASLATAAGPEVVIALQRTAGNAAVSRVLTPAAAGGALGAAVGRILEGLRSGPAGPIGMRTRVDPELIDFIRASELGQVAPGTLPAGSPETSANPAIQADDPSSAYAGHAGAPFVRGEGDAGRVDPNDVTQGNLGDCYLLAAAAAVARLNPALIERMIHENGDGTYNVTLHVSADGVSFLGRGESTTVRVDSRFPTGPGGPATPGIPAAPGADTTPTYAQHGDTSATRGPELWVMLIEKAYAVLRGQGTFQAIESGKGSEGVRALTGVASTWHSMGSRTDAEILSDIRSALDDGKPVTCPTPAAFPTAAQATATTWQAVQGHAYTPSDVDVSAQTLDLQNPWGRRHLIGLGVADFRALFSGYTVADESIEESELPPLPEGDAYA